MTDGIEGGGDAAGTASSQVEAVDDVLEDLRQRVEQIDALDLSDRVAALEQVNEGLVRALGELDDL